MKIIILLFVCFFVSIPFSNGCHNYHHRRKRQANENDEIFKIERTRDLRNDFAECMDRKTQRDSISWRSVLDFTILDTNWYFNTNQNNCSDRLEQDTAECWKSRLPDLINEHSSLINDARDCIDEYATGFPPPNCTNGQWSRFFNDDNPIRGGDFEGFGAKIRRYGENILCRNPTGIDVRLANGADYRTAGQTVTLGTTLGFTCSNSDQRNGTQCQDYMVRFCCPSQPARVIIRRQAKLTFSTSQRENRLFENCLSQSINLPSNRRDINYSSVIKLAENYLVCNRNNGSDCSLRLDVATANKYVLLRAWSYILEAVTRQGSPLLGGVATCNQQIFPPQLIIERITSGGRGWSAWSSWGHCPARCGESGTRLRRRHCVGGPPRVFPCFGRLHHSEPCQPPSCGIRWSNWNQWSICPNNLPTSYRVRSRTCINNFVEAAGNCQGSSIQRESCGTDIGDPYRNFSPWTVIGPCQGECGHHGASEPIQRFCTIGANGSPGCAPPYEDTQACTRQCGHWGPWITNSPCTVTCGGGTRTRHRQCVEGLIGEPGCFGSAFGAIVCNLLPCPTQIISGWSNWGSWEQFQRRCNRPSTQSRMRTCTIGIIGSPSCPGPNRETRTRIFSCGSWGSWITNSPCSVTCGSGTRSRQRICNGGQAGEAGCEGPATESLSCDTRISCPVRIVDVNGWSDWGNWEQCQAQCNQRSRRVRRRFCTVGHIGSPGCPGSEVDSEECMNRCGSWSNWSPFTECAGICGISTRYRTRNCEGGIIGQPNCYGNAIETHQCWTGRPC